MSRIESKNINFGSSFVLNAEGKTNLNKEISDAGLIADSIVAEAKKQAQAILAQAQTQAQQMIAQAEEQARASQDEITAEWRRKGYEEGYQDGSERIISDMEDLIYNINNFAKCRFEIKNRIIKSLHRDILELVLEISQKICKTQITQNDEVLEKVIIEAISHLKEKENVTVIVNPVMAEKIYAISEDIKNAVHTLESVKVIEDSSISPDGTIVESVGSRIDARVSAQIEQLAHKLFDQLNSTPEMELAKELEEVETQDPQIAQEEITELSYTVDELNNDKPDEI